MSDGVSWYTTYFNDTWDSWIGLAGRMGVREPKDREEIVQQAFLELWKSRNHVALWRERDPDGIGPHRQALDGFMHFRVKHRVFDRWRAQAARREYPVGELFEELQAEAWPSDGPDHWTNLIDSKKWIIELVNTLPPRDRAHVVLVALGAESSFRAELLHLKPGNERVRWLRLKKRLQDQLNASGMGEQGVAE